VYQYSRPPLSDVSFKTHLCKAAFCVLSRNRKKHFHILFDFEFIRFSNRGVLSAALCIIRRVTKIGTTAKRSLKTY